MPEPLYARRATSFRRRRPLPAISLIVVLGLVATIVWIRTLDTAEKRTDLACAPPHAVTSELQPSQQQPGEQQPGQQQPGQQPAEQPPRGEVLAPNALDDVDPLPPDAVKVRVLNANGE